MAEAEWHPKREARRFEPPPWEREQFEALQKRREQDVVVEAAPAPAREAGTVPLEEPILQEEAAQELAPVVVAEAAAGEPEEPKREADPAEVDAMLARLQAEEPRVDEHLTSLSVFASGIAMLLGVSMFAWGLYALMAAQKTPATVVGSMVVLAMGLMFGLTGLWVGWRATNKQEEK